MTTLHALHRRLQEAPPAGQVLLVTLLTLGLGGADLATGEEISFAVFYTIPVSAAAWSIGPPAALGISLLSAVTWLAADLLAGATYSSAWIPYWNAGARLGFFLIIAALLVRLRGALEIQRSLAEQDLLTGLANSRKFLEDLRVEVARSARYRRPVSLAYIDLDGFKGVNDRFGHSTGDKVLAAVGKILKGHTRATDLTARLGGDEFAVLIPEADAQAALLTVEKLRDRLSTAMAEGDWPVGFSIGIFTSRGDIDQPDEIIRRADALMFEGKHSGKGRIVTATSGDIAPSPSP